MQRRFYDILICLGLLAILAALIIFPGEAVSAAAGGVTLCLNVIVPSLFPFFVVSSLIVNLGLAERAGKHMSPLMRPLFNTSGAASAALILGIVGGYPVGARTVVSLYGNNAISKQEAEKLLAFCNNSGPAFILGVVGAGIFGSGMTGILLLISHILSAIITGLVFRRYGGRCPVCTPVSGTAPRTFFITAFVDGVKSSFMSVLGVCGFVIFFNVVIQLLTLTGVVPLLSRLIGMLGFGTEWATRFITGILELFSGVWTLSSAENLTASAMMASFMLGWGGLSVHFQTLSLLSGSGLRTGAYFAGNLLQGIISAVITFAMSPLLTSSRPASAFLYSGYILSSTQFTGALAVSLAVSAVILIVFVFVTKNSGKNRTKRL